MKRIYWRPRGVSTNALLVLAALSTVSIGLVETFPERQSEIYLNQMLEASQIANEAIRVVRSERGARKIPVDPIADPSDSGLIGVSISDVTSNTGNLLAKQTTVNPNWAAVAVKLLREAGVNDGDTIAVGVSGSFPGLNIAVFSAIEAMHLQAIAISSASASQWGANHPRLLWLDMEQVLKQRKVFKFRSVATSLGGAEDRAASMSEEGLALLRRGIRRSKLPLIDVENYAESVIERMTIYQENAAGRPIRAYVNVGGGTSSTGTRRSKFAFQPGLNTRTPPPAALIDSVMARFLDQDVPVIHFLQINRMAERYGLPIAPQIRPPVGTGRVFLEQRYSPVLASAALITIVLGLFLFIRSGRGRMALESRRKERQQLEPTV